MAALTVESVAERARQNPKFIKEIKVISENVTQIEDLSSCAALEKVDLSKNALEDASGLKKCRKIHWLNISSNKLRGLQFAANLMNLKVLNGAYNQIRDLDCIAKLNHLKALILNNNCIARPPNLSRLTDLNTLVLSHNELEMIDVTCLVSLVKLQLSHNKLQDFPNIKFNPSLKSLSLNDNCISQVPEDCLADTMNRLELVDLGKNVIKKIKHVKALSKARKLQQLNLLNNQITEKKEYVSKMQELFPTLRILNTKPISKLIEQESPKSGGSNPEDIESKKTEKHHVPPGKKKDLSKAADGEKDQAMSSSEVTAGRKKKKTSNPEISTVVESPDAGDHNNPAVASFENQHWNIVSTDSKQDSDQEMDSESSGYASPGKKRKQNKDSKHNKRKKPKLEVIHNKHQDSSGPSNSDDVKTGDKQLRLTAGKKKKDKGTVATKNSESGVLSIKNIKKHSKHEKLDIFSSFQTDIGSGAGSSW